MNAVTRACEVVGGMACLAGRLNVAAPTVAAWVSGKRPVPVIRCVAIERETGGAVTRKDLRPKDWRDIWPELAAATDQEAAHA